MRFIANLFFCLGRKRKKKSEDPAAFLTAGVRAWTAAWQPAGFWGFGSSRSQQGDGNNNAIMFLRQETSEFALNEELPVFKLVRISADKLSSNENTRVGGRG